MDLHSVIPEANFNEEKQTLLVAYCATAERPRPSYSERKQCLPGCESAQLLCAVLKTKHGTN